MTLSAALDSGIAFGVLVVFFVFIYPGWMSGFKWWGTEIYKQASRNFHLFVDVLGVQSLQEHCA